VRSGRAPDLTLVFGITFDDPATMLERLRAKMPMMNDGYAELRCQLLTVKLWPVRECRPDVREGDDASSARSPTVSMNQDTTRANNRAEDEFRYPGTMMPGSIVRAELVERGLEIVIGVEPATAIGGRRFVCLGLPALRGCHGVRDAVPPLALV